MPPSLVSWWLIELAKESVERAGEFLGRAGRAFISDFEFRICLLFRFSDLGFPTAKM
jgi:hypothetical protein